MIRRLLEKEVIFQNDLIELIGERPFSKATTYAEFVNKEDEQPKEEEKPNEVEAQKEEVTEPTKTAETQEEKPSNEAE